MGQLSFSSCHHHQFADNLRGQKLSALIFRGNMPFSYSNQLSTIVGYAEQQNPATILDVGIGMGQYGFLLRTNLENINLFEINGAHARQRDKHEWKIRIDGIEGYPGYINAVHEYAYQPIHRRCAGSPANSGSRNLRFGTGYRYFGTLRQRARQSLLERVSASLQRHRPGEYAQGFHRARSHCESIRKSPLTLD